MDMIWYAGLGALFAAYFVLGGYDYGVGLLVSRAGTQEGRRAALNAVGPFFLGNEVWLIAAAGVLFGAFPLLEGELLSGLYPAVAVALVGVITVTAAVQLRSRPTGAQAVARWDAVITVASALAAAGWGAVLGGLLQGVPAHSAGYRHLATAFVAISAATMIALVGVHGAAFLALRLAAGEAEHFARLGRRLVVLALGAIGAAVVVGAATHRVRDAVRQPVPTVLLLIVLVVALLLARAALVRRRPGLAFAATATALALPVLIVGFATYPYALAPAHTVGQAGLTIGEAAADPATLRLLNWLAAPLVPALVGIQVMSWWVFRGRLDPRTAIFY
jgi:cytochrome d ubiquinol oxidase subunit II